MSQNGTRVLFRLRRFAALPALVCLICFLQNCGYSSAPSSSLAPSITTQPSTQSVTAGQKATFTVVASGTTPLTYQWKKGSTDISGAASASYTTPATTMADNGSMFQVTVSNSAGSMTSNPATLNVTAAPVAPTITTQPSNRSVNVGQTATFTVVASGTTPLSYQWKKGTTNIAGATSPSYTTPAATLADNGSQFTVVVSNSVGNVTSNPATLGVTAVAPAITTQPSDRTVAVGLTATFTVVASGTAPLTYQWQKGAANISGATSPSYTTPATTSADSGSQFQVVVTNSAGSVTSNPATLTVTSASTGTDVVTYHNDVGRTGQNLTETTLTPTNVSSTTFGKIGFFSTDGLVDAQPLYLSQLNIAGGTHNVLYVVSEHDTAYAFDADTGTVLWQKSMLGSGETTSDPVGGCGQVSPEIGITSTPVIDRANGVIYLVAMSKNGSTYIQRIHALDITTGRSYSAAPR